MDSLEAEMSRFEREVLGAPQPTPQPLMANAPPLMTEAPPPRPLMTGAPPLRPPMGAPVMTGAPPIRPPMGAPVMTGAPPIRPPMGAPVVTGAPPMRPPMGPPPVMTGAPPLRPPMGPPPVMTGIPPPAPTSTGMKMQFGFVPRQAMKGQTMGNPPLATGGFPPPPAQAPGFPPPPFPHQPGPSCATPLNPMAIAQAVAGSSGASVGGGASLLPAPNPSKKSHVGKLRSDPKKLRVGGGKVWEDRSLDDWDQNDFRIFVGDLGNDVNDDTLTRSFSRFPSFLRARVIRDKYSKKTKGYGFVSFRDPKDFMSAMREMNGRYIGNRPVKLRKSTWRDRQMLVVKKKEKEKKRLGFK